MQTESAAISSLFMRNFNALVNGLLCGRHRNKFEFGFYSPVGDMDILWLKILLLTTTFALPAHASLPPALQPLSNMVQQLCEKSPEIVSANENLSLAIETEQVNSRYLIPKINLGASVGLLPATVGNETSLRGTGTSGLLGATVDWGLTPWNGPQLALQKARLNHRLTKVLRVQQLQTEITELIEQMLNLSRLQAREKDLLATRQRLERQYQIAKSSVRQGVAKRTDQQRFETEVLRFEDTRLTLERSRLESTEKLHALLGTEVTPEQELPWQPLGNIQIQNPDPQTPTPELEAQELRTKIAELEREIQFAQTGLVTSLQGQYAYQNSTRAPAWNSDSLRTPWSSNWSLFVNLRYPLWDNGTEALSRRQAAVTAGVSQVSLEQARRNFIAAQKLFLDQRQRVEQRRALADKLFRLEKLSFAQVETDYREGRIGYLEWLNSNQSLQSAVSSQIDASVEWARLWILSANLKGELAHDFCP